MSVLLGLDRFLLSSALGKTLLGPIFTTGAAVLLGLPSDPQPSPLHAGRLTLVLLVVCGTWDRVPRSDLSTQPRFRDSTPRSRPQDAKRNGCGIRTR